MQEALYRICIIAIQALGLVLINCGKQIFVSQITGNICYTIGYLWKIAVTHA